MRRTGKMAFKQVTVEGTAEGTIATRDASGEPVPTWPVFATRYADIEPLAGRELVAAQQRFAETTHQVRIRYLAGLNSKTMRLKQGTRVFDITGVLDKDDRHQEQIVYCKQGVGSG
jgi:SPP1 family predicted phage head-tail adaptor